MTDGGNTADSWREDLVCALDAVGREMAMSTAVVVRSYLRALLREWDNHAYRVRQVDGKGFCDACHLFTDPQGMCYVRRRMMGLGYEDTAGGMSQ